MSAERDPQQGLTFNFTNFYHLYRYEQVAKGLVLKAKENTSSTSVKDLFPTPVAAKATVITPEQTEALRKWTHLELNHEKKDLLNQMRSLRNAKKRLSFLMNEVDDILKREE